MRYWDWMNKYDSWKTKQPHEKPEIEICVIDIGQVQESFLKVDEEAVIQAYKSGQRDFPGLDVCEIY